MTFKALQDRALEECGYDFSGSSSTPRTRAKARINDWHRRLLSRPGFSGMLRQAFNYTFASVASQSVYGFPMMAGRIDAITEHDNMRRLEMRTLDWLRTEDPGLTASGTPWVWIPRGWAPVQLQPSNASTIAVKSTSAGDTNTARIEYLNASGQRLTSSVVMTGTTAANVVATVAVEITELYLSAAAVGTVTIYEDSDIGTVLGVIPIGYTSVRFLQFQLWPTPGAVITYYLDATRELADLVQDKEEPLLNPDFQDLLWLGAVSDEWRLKDDSRYQIVRQDLESRTSDFNNWLWNQVDYQPAPSNDRLKYSRLGGWYPPGT